MTRDERLNELNKIPRIAALDHRYFLDDQGRDKRMSALSRHDRRRLEAEARKLSERYNKIMRRVYTSGAGYPVDKFIRTLAIEYTHRYASSGTMNQPASFNYFESFCAVRLIEGSTAPYAEPRDEYHHLFSVPDYFDYLTSSERAEFSVSDLQKLPEGAIYHFSQNGSVSDFTYMNSRGKEFVISGFSMIRHGSALHWYMVGGEILSKEELEILIQNESELDLSETPEHKRKFLEEMTEKRGRRSGPPLVLEGTATAARTIIAGEFDLIGAKHSTRCYMKETENSYNLLTDDPDIFHFMTDLSKRNKIFSNMKTQLEEAAVLWDLAEGFFQLQNYFEFRLTVPDKIVEASGLPKPRTTKGGRGVGAEFRHVASLEVSDVKPSMLVSYMPPPFEIETEGYWHRLDHDSVGKDREGNPIKGRDWIKADVTWRARAAEQNTVFIKSSVSSAKIAISDYVKAAEAAGGEKQTEKPEAGVLYVMRCVAMKDEIYKVGWTSRSAEERAKELSTTGIPVPFEVVEYWKHDDPAALERGIHALLDPYRIVGNREFFEVRYRDLHALIEQEIARTGTFESSRR